MKWLASGVAVGALCVGMGAVPAADALWQAKPLTPEKAYTPGIEGPATDRKGVVYAVNYARQGTIGRTTADGKTEVYVELPKGSVGNGIRFDRAGAMYIADYPKHNILRVDPKTRKITVFAHEDQMHQPNDLAIGPDGTLYASDPNWKASTGQLWRIGTSGKVLKLAGDLGTTNGIEVSPDGKKLYVNESVQRNIWQFDITPEGIANKRLLIKFPDHGFDGMRCDAKGNLYVTRYGKGTVAVVSPEGKIIREIEVLGARPSNLCFGGPDGKTVFVTEVEHQRLVTFRADTPGLEWERWRK
jgi:gluconolactonase